MLLCSWCCRLLSLKVVSKFVSSTNPAQAQMHHFGWFDEVAASVARESNHLKTEEKAPARVDGQAWCRGNNCLYSNVRFIKSTYYKSDLTCLMLVAAAKPRLYSSVTFVYSMFNIYLLGNYMCDNNNKLSTRWSTMNLMINI